MMKVVLVVGFVCCVFGMVLSGSDSEQGYFTKEKEGLLSLVENDAAVAAASTPLAEPLMVELSLINGADSKGAGILSLSFSA